MKKYGLQSFIFTTLRMERLYLITKETSKAAYEGKLKNKWDWKYYKGSINDDLESFLNNLQEISSLEEIKKEVVRSFFLPKLTEKELKLVEEKDNNLMSTLFENIFGEADVDENEMKKSDSKDKYLHGCCFRQTRVLELPLKR